MVKSIAFCENYCRLCKEFFCCKKCRLIHEQNYHDVYPECDICIYGITFLKTPSDNLLRHYKTAHWPLNCILCKKVFSFIEELKSHRVCSMARKPNKQENSSVLVQSTSIEQNYDSPPITTTMHKSILTSSNKRFNAQNNRALLTTSTPMQKNNEKELLDQIPEIITPVDYPGKTDTFEQIILNEATKSSSVKSLTNEETKNIDPFSKRRVTFSEIEIINYPDCNQVNEEYKTEETNRNLQEPVVDSSNAAESEAFITAVEDISSKFDIKKNLKKNIDKEFDLTSKVLEINDSNISITMWETAYFNLDGDTIDELKSPTNNSHSVSNLANPDESHLSDQCLNVKEISHVTNQTSSKAVIEENKINLVKETQLIVNMNSDNLNEVENQSLNAFHSILPFNLESNIASSTINLNTEEPVFIPNDTTDLFYETDKISEEGSKQPTPKVWGNLTSKFGKSLMAQKENIESSETSKSGIWSSMSNVFKTVVHGLSRSPCSKQKSKRERSKNSSASYKRCKSDSDSSLDRSPTKKRIKLTDIQCRKTIRNIRPFYELGYGKKKVKTYDKSTQTDF